MHIIGSVFYTTDLKLDNIQTISDKTNIRLVFLVVLLQARDIFLPLPPVGA